MKLLIPITALLVTLTAAKNPNKGDKCDLELNYRCGKDGHSIDICKNGKWAFMEGCKMGYFCVFDAYALCSNRCDVWPARC